MFCDKYILSFIQKKTDWHVHGVCNTYINMYILVKQDPNKQCVYTDLTNAFTSTLN